ncbi:MAG: monofunctional biosynthetic peptidoglycan transglycosylase [Acinetobacter sp.]
MKAFLARAVMLIIGIILLIQLWIFGSLVWWRTQPVETTMFMRWDYLTDFKPIQQDWRDYDDIGDNFKHAILAAEDAKFIHHHGFDWAGIQFALERNNEKGEVVAGGSTISQQLAKNLFLYNKRSFIRKGQEAVATWMMERMWSKRRILEVYMNSVEFGQNIYGVEAAAQFYYGKSSKSLTCEQAAFLAALLPNPKYYQDHRNDHKLQFRKHVILRYMNSTQIPQ